VELVKKININKKRLMKLVLNTNAFFPEMLCGRTIRGDSWKQWCDDSGAQAWKPHIQGRAMISAPRPWLPTLGLALGLVMGL
jgi:hypothetical protein